MIGIRNSYEILNKIQIFGDNEIDFDFVQSKIFYFLKMKNIEITIGYFLLLITFIMIMVVCVCGIIQLSASLP